MNDGIEWDEITQHMLDGYVVMTTARVLLGIVDALKAADADGEMASHILALEDVATKCEQHIGLDGDIFLTARYDHGMGKHMFRAHLLHESLSKIIADWSAETGQIRKVHVTVGQLPIGEGGHHNEH
jgi:hypothetical protein